MKMNVSESRCRAMQQVQHSTAPCVSANLWSDMATLHQLPCKRIGPQFCKDYTFCKVSDCNDACHDMAAISCFAGRKPEGMMKQSGEYH